MGLESIRSELTEELNAIIEDTVEDEIFDMVTKPKHYNTGKYETYDIIVDVLGKKEAIHYCRGNVLKYMLHRLWNKGDPIENACKAQWYLEKMIELMKETEGTDW
tara:strand:+ start:1128 stop:1442 length:315 start_codon:yes stop_codon:yes gene_type:complete